MIKNKKEKITTVICIVALLASFLLFNFSNSSTVRAIEENNSDIQIKLQYWTDGIIVSDVNISAISSSGTGASDDPYIIDNLVILPVSISLIPFLEQHR